MNEHVDLITTEGVLMAGRHVEPGTVYRMVPRGQARELISTGRFRLATPADLGEEPAPAPAPEEQP